MRKQLNKAIALAAVLWLGACAGGVEGLGREDGMPSDVNRFLKDRAACHASVDDAYFDDDALGLGMSQNALYCTGSEEKLTYLREKYAARPDVLRALDRLETQIEQGTR